MRVSATLCAGAALAALSGCSDRNDEVYVRHEGPAAHVCTVECHDHYYREGRIVYLKAHRHEPGCGHAWDGARYVAAPERAPQRVYSKRGRGVEPERVGPPHGRPVQHVCTPACHEHVHDGRRLVVLRGHRHADGCGHHWDGRHWVAVRTKTLRR